MRQKKSCGVIVMRPKPQMSFLLMRHPNRYDLPKGHVEGDEDEWGCALRELYEETGIQASDLHLDQDFRFTVTYQTNDKKLNDEIVEKTVVIFLGWLKHKVKIKLTEHSGYKWVKWKPPHVIQKKTIDPLLVELEKYFLEDSFRLLNKSDS